jgi:hypothetical protein
MSNKKARRDPIDFHVRLRGEGSDRIDDLELPRSAALSSHQHPRVLSVLVRGDTISADFFKECDALTADRRGNGHIRCECVNDVACRCEGARARGGAAIAGTVEC